jgi:hypothetical protein
METDTVEAVVSTTTETTTDPESFKEEDAEAFSKLISKRKDLHTPQDLIKLYYNFPEEELGSSVIHIDTVRVMTGGFGYTITLTHNGLEDDSLQGIKLVMKAMLEKEIWKVLEVKRNWRCRESRGSTAWGVEACS